MKKIFLALLLCSAQSFALTISSLSPSHGPVGTVVTITGSGFTGAPHVALVTSQAAEVYTIVSDTSILYTVPADAGLVAQPLQIFNNSLEAEAIFTVDAAASQPAPPAVPIPPPRCMIDQFVGNFHTGTSAAGDSVAILWCDDQIDLSIWNVSGNRAQALANLSCLSSVGPPTWSLAWIQSAWAACVGMTQTADQLAAIQALKFKWVPRLNVTGPANQNVYTAKADGSKGPQFVSGGFGMQVAPQTGCGGARLQKAGARYADVSGQVSTNGVTLPPGSFALCSITYPPLGGFTN